MTDDPKTDEPMTVLKTSLVKLHSAWNAQLIIMSASIASLEGLVLALSQRLGLDKAAANRLLGDHAKTIALDRLVTLEDRDPLIAAHTAAFLEEWLDPPP